MMYRVNTFMGCLIITIAGVLASSIIIHVAYNNVFSIAYYDGVAQHIPAGTTR